MKRLALRSYLALALLAPVLAFSDAGAAFYQVKVGDPVPADTLESLEGKKVPLLGKDVDASLFIFVRPEHENSVAGLKDIAKCMKLLEGQKIHWVALVSDEYSKESAAAILTAAEIDLPVLVDAGNANYGRLGVVLHPSVGITDRQGKLAAYVPFTTLNFCAVVEAHLRFLVGQIDQAELDRRLNPPAAVSHSDDSAAKRNVKLAQMMLKAGKAEQALGSARKALETTPDHPAAHGVAAEALARQGQCAAALEHAGKAGADDPHAQEARRLCTSA